LDRGRAFLYKVRPELTGFCLRRAGYRLLDSRDIGISRFSFSRLFLPQRDDRKGSSEERALELGRGHSRRGYPGGRRLSRIAEQA